LVATTNDALVNDGGKLVHLEPETKEWNSLVQGGRFETTNMVIEIRAGTVRRQREELVERDTDLSIMRGGQGFKTFHGPPWVCGPKAR
jgi:hypothetical protein